MNLTILKEVSVMKLAWIQRLIRLVEKSKIEELNISKWLGLSRIRIRKLRTSSAQNIPNAQSVLPITSNEPKIIVVKSEMVGTFHPNSSPDKSPLVQEGDQVSPGDILGYIEAMNLMNEILSPIKGVVVEVLVSPKQPVEFGQELFKIQPTN